LYRLPVPWNNTHCCPDGLKEARKDRNNFVLHAFFALETSTAVWNRLLGPQGPQPDSMTASLYHSISTSRSFCIGGIPRSKRVDTNIGPLLAMQLDSSIYCIFQYRCLMPSWRTLKCTILQLTSLHQLALVVWHDGKHPLCIQLLESIVVTSLSSVTSIISNSRPLSSFVDVHRRQRGWPK
jgi:hypothetical protein